MGYNKYLLSILFIGNLLSVLAQNFTFSGRITSDTTWAADTLIITDDVIIDSNVTLTIMPGTFIHILGYYSIRSYGSIRAIGTISDSIVLTHLDTIQHADTSTTSGGWHGIRLLPRSINDTSYFEYCHISNGKSVIPGNHSYNDPENRGGNLYGLSFGSLVVRDSYIGNGRVKGGGGGFWLEEGRYVLIDKCLFENNYANQSYGGGACIYEVDTLYVTKCLFYKNTCFNKDPLGIGGNGAGIAALYGLGYNAFSLIENNSFFNNKAAVGILYSGYYNANVNGNLICNNYGLGLWQAHMFNYPIITNNTVVNNEGLGWCGIEVSTRDALLLNNIVRGNFDSDHPEDPIEQIFWMPSVSGPPTVKYCNIQYGFEGDSNIDQDALFVNPTEGIGLAYDGLTADWTLQDNSPSINTGTPDTSGLFLPELDLADNPRIFGNRIDMGAYENQHVWVKINDTPMYANQISLYPNPATGSCTIDIPKENQFDTYTLLVYNLMGVKTEEIDVPSGETRVVLPLSNYAPGLYSVITRSGGSITGRGKFVVY